MLKRARRAYRRSFWRRRNWSLFKKRSVEGRQLPLCHVLADAQHRSPQRRQRKRHDGRKSKNGHENENWRRSESASGTTDTGGEVVPVVEDEGGTTIDDEVIGIPVLRHPGDAAVTVFDRHR